MALPLLSLIASCAGAPAQQAGGPRRALAQAAAQPAPPKAAAAAAAAPLACPARAVSGPAAVANCTYLIGSPQAAGELLRAAALQGAPRAAAPLPAVTVAARAPAPPPPPPPRGARQGAQQKQPPAAPAPEPLFHEAGVWLPGLPGPHTVLFTSNRLGNLSTPDQRVTLTLVDPTGASPPKPLPKIASQLPMANGGTLLPGSNGTVAVLTFQGFGKAGGGLAAVNLLTSEVKIIVSSAGSEGAPFSSPNDVVVLPLRVSDDIADDGANGAGDPGFYGDGGRGGQGGGGGDGGRHAVALITDPPYGYDQRFRTAPPQLGNYVWAVTLRLPPARAAGAPAPARWWPVAVGPARAVADGFERPNGLAVSPDRSTVYVSDTGYFSGGGEVILGDKGGLLGTVGSGPPLRSWAPRPSAIYAFDLSFDGAAPRAAALRGRRTFAVADAPIPDGLRCDAAGRLFSGEGDGVSAYEPGTGRLLLRVRPGAAAGARAAGVANFALAGGGGGGWLVMGQEQQATAVRLPGLKVFDVDSWLQD